MAGRTIWVTRPAKQAAGLAEPLEALGATVVSLPAIEIVPPESFEALDAALADVDRFDWLVFTSVNGVAAVRDRMDALGSSRFGLRGTRIAAVGPATAQAVRETFGEPAAVPETYVGEAVADAMGEVRGRWVLLARADIARRGLPELLLERGALVEEVAAYRIVRSTPVGELPDVVPDWIALTSSSAVHATLETLTARGREPWMREARLACIGPLTAATVRELGYEAGALAGASTIPALVEAIVAASGTPLPSGGGGAGGEGQQSVSRSSSTGTPSPTVFHAGARSHPFVPQGKPSPEELLA